MNIPKDKKCPACSRPPAEITPQYASPVCAAPHVVEEISCTAAADMKNATLIDVRERNEWDAGHIDGAQNLPLSALRDNPGLFKPFAEKTPCILYCQRGRRSMTAAEILQQAGFTGLYSMTGGYEAWRTSGR